MKICPVCQTSYGDAAGFCSRDGSALTGLLDAGTVLRKKYRIVGEIGRGGMATVYRAWHLIFNEDRAIKVLLQPGGQAFLAEAQVMRRLQHPHIVRVEDADFTEDNHPFVVMEYIDGEDLKRRVRRTGPLDPEEALRIAAEACSALAAAHATGVIHRDIKPQNLLLARRPDGGETLKVIDFGIATVREEAGLGFTGVLTSKSGDFVGTPEYASPEQALGVRGSELDGRSDLYSLGLVLYEMLTGTLPFQADTPMGVLVKRLNSAPAPPQQVKTDLPAAACEVVMRALQRECEARYASAAEMQAACEGALARIKRDRDEAMRREEEARAAEIAAEQRRQAREQRGRRTVEGLRSAARDPSAVLRRLLTRKVVRAAAVALGVLVVLGLVSFAYVYAKYGRVVDERLRAAFASIPARLFPAPESVGLGDVTTPSEIAARLRRSGYSESRSNPVGSYQIQANSISVFPGSDAFFDQEAGVIQFAGGKISQVISLRDNTTHSSYQLEPQPMTNLGGEKRRMVKFHDMPPVLIQAVTSAEDKRFFQHSGFNPFAGETITQKLVDLLWAPQNQWSRAIITMQIEQKLSKEQIFEAYCYQANLGSRRSFRIRGFGEAAEAFLGRDISQVNLAEAAELASLPNSPDNLDPFRHPDGLIERRNEVLGLMRANGYISDRDYALAVQAPLTVARAVPSMEAPYFVDLLNETLLNRFQNEDFQSNGFRVYTTLDLRLSRAAAEAVRLGMQNVDEQIRKQPRFQGQTPPEPQVALVALDPHTGAVKALMGGRNHGMSQLNHALANRQPGSIFKPFVYAAGMDTAVQGGPRILTPSTIVKDEPTTFQFDGQPYEPAGYGKKFRGDVTLREALAYSLNIPAVKVAEMVGYNTVVDMANRAGMNYKTHPAPSIALGTYGITPMDAAGAYTIFANHGAYVKPSWLAQVRSHKGPALYKGETEQKPVLDPRVSYLMTNLMEDALRNGAAGDVRSKYAFDVPAAGMTGTSRDGWFAGYTSELLCVVWVGFDDNRDLDLDGADSAGPIWMEFMKRALQYREYRDTKPFTVPDGIVSIDIDPRSGMPATRSSRTSRKEVYISGTEPTGRVSHEGVPKPVKAADKRR